MYIGLHVQSPFLLSDFNTVLIFSIDFTKIRPAGAELLHVDGRTDMAKLIFALRNFPNAHKNQSVNVI